MPTAFLFVELEDLPQTKKDRATILQHSRDTYAEPWEPKADHSDPEPDEPEITPPKKDDDDPFAPSPEL